MATPVSTHVLWGRPGQKFGGATAALLVAPNKALRLAATFAAPAGIQTMRRQRRLLPSPATGRYGPVLRPLFPNTTHCLGNAEAANPALAPNCPSPFAFHSNPHKSTKQYFYQWNFFESPGSRNPVCYWWCHNGDETLVCSEIRDDSGVIIIMMMTRLIRKIAAALDLCYYPEPKFSSNPDLYHSCSATKLIA
ncbi:hypothetical protein TcasGA2_TC009886 [Tribolium castaneum]|uniref:Uncharacterized protein n=1 Tax=Tribolium castaneum TaxID=7070 RepID=D6WQ81_TRICA|nr:hypothetical protein TcasGA2_TC009886 [Tribolium castaneum]